MDPAFVGALRTALADVTVLPVGAAEPDDHTVLVVGCQVDTGHRWLRVAVPDVALADVDADVVDVVIAAALSAEWSRGRALRAPFVVFRPCERGYHALVGAARNAECWLLPAAWLAPEGMPDHLCHANAPAKHQLLVARLEAADASYASYDFGAVVEEADGWGYAFSIDEWERLVVLAADQSGDSPAKSASWAPTRFRVRFAPDSEEVLDVESLRR